MLGLTGQRTPAPLFSPANSFLSIGGTRNSSGNDSLFFSGAVDEVAIYNKVLTLSEIDTLYNNGGGLTL